MALSLMQLFCGHSGKALCPVSAIHPGAGHSSTSKILPQQSTKILMHGRTPLSFQNKPTRKIGCRFNGRSIPYQTGRVNPFFAGFTKYCGFPLAKCTSGAAQKAAPRRRERRAGCCCYSLKRSLGVMPSSSGRSGWSAGRSLSGASWSAGSFSAASASSGPRWKAY